MGPLLLLWGCVARSWEACRVGAVLLLACATAAAAQPAELKPADLKPGLVAEYEGAGNGPPQRVVRLESTVAVLLEAGETVHPRLAALGQVRWTGYVNVVRGGAHRFSATLRRGRLVVRVDGQEVLRAEADEAEAVVQGPAVALAGGVRRFEAQWQCRGTPARCTLWWEGPGFIREPLNGHYLGHLLAQRPAEFQREVQREHGRFLFEELGCARCHRPGDGAGEARQAAERLSGSLADRTGPPLTGVGRRIYAGWLDAWLADPQKLRPQTVMPRLFSDDARGRAERYAIVQLFVQQAGGPLPVFRPPLLANNDWKQSMARGQTLFYVTGCAACHQESKPQEAGEEEESSRPALQPEDCLYGLGTRAGAAAKYLLGALGSKTRPEVLAAYLRDPLAVHPGGRMPRMQLQTQEATDLARYLCRQVDESVPAELPVAPPGVAAKELFAAHGMAVPAGFEQWPAGQQWVAAGEMLLTAKGCVNCHEVEVNGRRLTGRPATALERVLGTAQLSGCLGEGGAVRYALAAAERQALLVFVQDGWKVSAAAAPAYRARVALRRYGCLNCHVRDGEGGLSNELAERMRLLEKAENADDVRPPVLTGIGHKARQSWLRGVLVEGQRARPWMQLRMPQYGVAVAELPEALPRLDGLPPDDTIRRVERTPERIAAGRQLIGKEGLGCISCHDISGIANPGTRGPDLATIQQRVRYEWYERWLHQPLRLAPGTRMPQAFADGQSTLKTVLGGQPQAQAEAMWAYLSLGPGLPLPQGLETPKGLILTVREHPELLRTFLPEVGARGIAVGYPQGVHFAYDAHSCRLVYAWSGNFLDVSPVWNNRGGAPAKPLGPKVWTAPEVPAWGWRKSGSEPPDFAGRVQNPAWGAVPPPEPPRLYSGPRFVEFEGYSLDSQGRPAFRSRVAAEEGGAERLRVSETPLPLRATVATGLVRQLRWQGPRGALVWFLAASGSAPPRLHETTSGRIRPWATDDKEAEITTEGVRVLLPQSGGGVLVVEALAAPAGSRWHWVKRGAGGELLLRLPPGEKGQVSGEAAVAIWSLPQDEETLIRALGR